VPTGPAAGLRRAGKADLFLSVSVIAEDFVKRKITAPQHRICFVIGLIMCNSTLRRPLSRICGTAEQLFLVGLVQFWCQAEQLQPKK
jgi:hypothetical protein